MNNVTGELDPWDTLPEFKPCIIYNDELRLTEMIMEDVLTVWQPYGTWICKGHFVDCGYAMDDGRLVGIKIWDDVRRRQV